MTKVKMTVSLSEEVAGYLRSTSSISSTIAEAVSEYRARELARTLEEAYKEDAEEASEIDQAWEPANAEMAE